MTDILDSELADSKGRPDSTHPDAHPPIISVEYEVLMGAQVNLDTSEVQVMVWAEDFNAVKPKRIYAGHHPDGRLPEYLEDDHPLARAALKLVDRVSVTVGDLHVPFELRDDPNETAVRALRDLGRRVADIKDAIDSAEGYDPNDPTSWSAPPGAIAAVALDRALDLVDDAIRTLEGDEDETEEDES